MANSFMRILSPSIWQIVIKKNNLVFLKYLSWFDIKTSAERRVSRGTEIVSTKKALSWFSAKKNSSELKIESVNKTNIFFQLMCVTAMMAFLITGMNCRSKIANANMKREP